MEPIFTADELARAAAKAAELEAAPAPAFVSAGRTQREMAQSSLWSVLRREHLLRVGMLIANTVGLAVSATTLIRARNAQPAEMKAAMAHVAWACAFLFVVLLISSGLVVVSHYAERRLRDVARPRIPPRKGERIRVTP